jgi:chorismate mutase
MQNLKSLREKIEKIDAEIIKKLAERQKISKAIGELKKQSGKTIADDARENELMNYYENLSTQYGLESKFIKHLFKVIIAYSKKLQEDL